MRKKSWIGVDFDRTLSKCEAAPGTSDLRTPGEPVPAMVERVKDWLNSGYDVRIVTARVASIYPDVEEHCSIIHKWCIEHIGKQLPVVSEKDGHMLELWDDSVVRVERNTGHRLSPSFIEHDPDPEFVCEACKENAARYVAFDPEVPGYSLLCGICPIKEQMDSILMRSIPSLMAWARALIADFESASKDKPVCVDLTTLRSIVGKDLSK